MLTETTFEVVSILVVGIVDSVICVTFDSFVVGILKVTKVFVVGVETRIVETVFGDAVVFKLVSVVGVSFVVKFLIVSDSLVIVGIVLVLVFIFCFVDVFRVLLLALKVVDVTVSVETFEL